MTPLLVLAEFVFTEEGETAFLPHLDRALWEVRGIDGCLQAVLWTRPGRRYQFSTLWSDADAVTRWVENDFHKTVLMPGFRKWCTEGCFGEYTLETDHKRARRCEICARWTQTLPGWDESLPSACEKCGAQMQYPRGLQVLDLVLELVQDERVDAASLLEENPMRIWIRRAYEAPTRNDGYRVLVDRVWPRGVSREHLEIDDWIRDLAPSTRLRKWFDHDPARWQEFQRRYFLELRGKQGPIRGLLDRIRRGRVTLVFGARDPDHNNAVALRAFLEKRARRDGGGRRE